MATRVVISAPRPAPFFAPLFVAVDRGFLAEQGIEGVIRYKAGLKEMVAGEVGFASGMAAYRQFLGGMPVRQICGIYYAHPYAWDEIGFGGPAYPRGYFALNNGAPEPWEPREAGPGGEKR